jgi:hypothetical protein
MIIPFFQGTKGLEAKAKSELRASPEFLSTEAWNGAGSQRAKPSLQALAAPSQATNAGQRRPFTSRGHD